MLMAQPHASNREQTKNLRMESCAHICGDGSNNNFAGIKRAVRRGKCGPHWKPHKHMENPSFDENVSTRGSLRDDIAATSVRKLAAALWELDLMENASASRVYPLRSPMQASSRMWQTRTPSYFNLSLKSTKPTSGRRKYRKVHPLRTMKLASCKFQRRLLRDFRKASKASHMLGHVQNHGESLASSRKMAPSMYMELQRSYSQVKELEQTYGAVRKELDGLLRKLAIQRVTWRKIEKGKFKCGIQKLKEEIQTDKESKHQLEMTISDLGTQLNEVNIALSEAMQGLEREKKTRELLEEVCNELAQEIANDKVEAEELKLASAKVKQEIEQDRQMLQMSEMWREQRVHMKLAEAQLQLEEKNAALGKLSVELETFLCKNRETLSSTVVQHDSKQKGSDEPYVLNGLDYTINGLDYTNTGNQSSREDFNGFGYHSDPNQATERPADEATGLLNNQNLRQMSKDGTSELERLKRTASRCKSCREPFTSAIKDIPLGFGCEPRGKTNGYISSGGMKQKIARLRSSNSDSSRRTDVKVEDSRVPFNMACIFDDTKDDGGLPLDARIKSWSLSSIASDDTYAFEGQYSFPATDLQSSLHISPLKSRQKPLHIFNTHLAKSFKDLVQWRKYKKRETVQENSYKISGELES